MNRRFLSVIAGGFGTGGGTSAAAGDEEQGEVIADRRARSRVAAWRRQGKS